VRTTAAIESGRSRDSEVRQDEVDAEVLVARETRGRRRRRRFAAALVDGHVLADLAEAAER
jgi:hypothetical protein